MNSIFKKQYIGHARHFGPYPENSISLYKYLVEELHYEIIEADIVFTKDGVPVLNHSVNGSFIKDGKSINIDISQIEYSELQKCYNRQFPISTVEEYVRFGKEKGVIIMLDLTFQNYTYSNYKTLYAIVSKYNMKEKTIWGDADIMKLSTIDRKLIVQFGGSWGRKMLLKTIIKSLFCKTTIMSFNYYGGNIEQFANIVRYGHKFGFIMKVATINDEEIANRFWEIGADLINTDNLLNK